MIENEISIIPVDAETVAASPTLSRLLKELPLDQGRVKLLRLSGDTESRQKIAKRMHDITSAVRSLRFMHDSLKEGYRFDDESAGDKITYIGRSVAVLEREERLLRSLLEP